MMPTADPILRWQRLHRATLVVGVTLAVGAGWWTCMPLNDQAVVAPPASASSAVVADRPVRSEHWRVALAPIAAPVPTAPPAPPIPMTLISIMTSGGQRRAMLSVGDGRIGTVTVGSVTAGWTVTRIDERAVTLTLGSESRVLELRP